MFWENGSGLNSHKTIKNNVHKATGTRRNIQFPLRQVPQENQSERISSNVSSGENLPIPKIPEGPKVISGYLYGSKPGFTLEERAPEYDSKLRQNLDLLAFASSAPYPIQPYVLRLDMEQPDGFVRAWPVPDQMAVRRHEAYAVQWFGMAAVFISVVVAMWRRELRARRRPVRNKIHE